MIWGYPYFTKLLFVHMFDRLRFHELEVGVAKRADAVKFPPGQVGLSSLSNLRFCSDILEDFGLPLVETTQITSSDLPLAGSAKSLVIGRSHTAPLSTASLWCIVVY